jgi:FtsZ-interacting cell division protein ZipA
MSDLQIGLLVMGVAVVVAVVLHNWMQERRFRQQADAAFQAPMADVLMQPSSTEQGVQGGGRGVLEPVFDAATAVDIGEREEPRLHVDRDVEWAGDDVQDVAPHAAHTAPYDELIEYRVRLAAESGLVDGAALAETCMRARAFGKTVRWLGLPAHSEEWEEFQPWRERRYQQVMVTMQLADRNGAVQGEQLAALCELAQAVAREYGLLLACDDIDEALERAQAIDHFCVDVDVLIGLNVVGRGDGLLNVAQIVREAQAANMVLAVDGNFQLLDSRGESLYALCNYDAEPFRLEVDEAQTTQGATLQFDVPRVPDGVRVFDGMVAFGRKLTNDVGGILVDDNLRPLSDTGIEKIRSQLTQIYERMEARGVPSGSRRSLRLFS